MQKNKTLIEDMMALSGNMLGNILGARHEMKAQAKQRTEFISRSLDLVTKREFDAAFAMLAKAREVQELLAERLAAIEDKLGMSSTSVIKSRTKRRLPSFKKGNQRGKRS